MLRLFKRICRIKGFSTKYNPRLFLLLLFDFTNHTGNLVWNSLSPVILSKCPAVLTQIINLYNETLWVDLCIWTLCPGGQITHTSRAIYRSTSVIKLVLPNNRGTTTSFRKIKAPSYLYRYYLLHLGFVKFPSKVERYFIARVSNIRQWPESFLHFQALRKLDCHMTRDSQECVLWRVTVIVVWWCFVDCNFVAVLFVLVIHALNQSVRLSATPVTCLFIVQLFLCSTSLWKWSYMLLP